MHPYWKLIFGGLLAIHVAVFAWTGSIVAVAKLFAATIFALVWMWAIGFIKLRGRQNTKSTLDERYAPPHIRS